MCQMLYSPYLNISTESPAKDTLLPVLPKGKLRFGAVSLDRSSRVAEAGREPTAIRLPLHALPYSAG